ncbi:Aminopeptidase [Streptomyces sp. RB5]|uniref:Aminopeptidase n=1 Tax=Streptomyces smaragdinus TaxID=2585196 RepID=A0A7K0CL55_9ACTN|nr:M28 family metallopeptidase [Streptomyces smaragdinus]MQY13732.1 Aminopeptidase [Streptomyces smaragdinus]
MTATLATAALAGSLLIGASGPSGAHGRPDPGKDARQLAAKLVKESSAASAHKHLRALQAIADANDGNRSAGSSGHDRSAEYVASLLRHAGYRVSLQTFDFFSSHTSAQTLSVVSPDPRAVDIFAMTFSKSTPAGGLTAPIAAVPVDADTTSGCDAADYAGTDYTGKIALVSRGGCTFLQKQGAAADAGAAAAIVWNNVPGALNGTLGDATAVRIPTGGVSQADGQALAAAAAAGTVTVTMDLQVTVEQATTSNVIAETRDGDPDNVAMFGAHLDSVAEGPGINDNGSGSAGLIEVALDLAKQEKKPRDKVRFAWWSAEELGLVGSTEYVNRLTEEQAAQISLYLNFDMIASPNYGLFVYDGDDSDAVGSGPGPEGSAQLERGITDFMDAAGYPHAGTDFTGRSDYGPFIAVGIPSGGTFTGAEGVKTAAEAAVFGGTAGVAYDSCYHQACDTIDNISMPAFDANIDVIANAVGTYAHDQSALTSPAAKAATTGSTTGGGLHEGQGVTR